ncbi:uncharacterized protein TNCT_107131, partial [Trichonephila clavata]
ISRRYLRASAITSYIDKWGLCLRKNTSESEISTQLESSETEYESEHESRHPSVMAFSGPHRYWDNYARVLGKESEKKEERKKQEHWKRHKSTEGRSRVHSKRNEANERKKQTDTKRNEYHDRKKSPPDQKRNEAKEKKKSNYSKKSRIPTPPALPTKSMMKQATKMLQHTIDLVCPTHGKSVAVFEIEF